MVAVAIGSLILGALCGQFVFSPQTVAMMDTVMSYALMLLLCSVGVEVGSNKTVFRTIRTYHLRILVIPFGVVAGSLLGGGLLGLAMGVPLNEACAISSGFGFYSLSAVLLRELGGAQLGTVAFLANVLRELLAFVCIPLAAKYLSHYAAIAPGGATAMDTTLPAITRATDRETALMAVISGVVLTALTPVLVPMAYRLL